MPLEKFFSGEQPINVKDLTIENPEKEEEGLPFDPEKEITAEDWKRIKEFLDETTLETYLPYAGVLQQVFPEKAEELELGKGITDARLQSLVAETKREPVDDPQREPLIAGIEYGLRVLFPDGRYSGRIEDAETVKKYFTKQLGGSIGGSTSGPFRTLHSLGFLAFAGPEDVKGFTADQRNAALQEDMKRILEDRDTGFFQLDSTIEAAYLRLLPCRGVASRISTNDDWSVWKKELNRVREDRRPGAPFEGRFILDIAAMKILAAEEVKMTEHGLEIVMRKPKPELETKTPPLPEHRNF